jgi:putative ubiquitin-RnfH superfamily antitoxin RatB of RatAB toxin-antitoxin module
LSGELIRVQVSYALVDRQSVLNVDVPTGTTVAEAIQRSGILSRHPEIDLEVNRVGVFGKLRKTDAIVEDAERIEIYRPLIADPKAARKERAKQTAD